ncbi:hypothetical protein H5410_058537 [Solanum commersonii]|uniref:Uncharacterized protein n=1 Tax=Solanum commersonii TaxID=4109 RepID=A0A9J5WR36_SOLCO|nr:hypothetical protein H5410_058537 [Solanum commersonii]
MEVVGFLAPNSAALSAVFPHLYITASVIHYTHIFTMMVRNLEFELGYEITFNRKCFTFRKP